MAEDESPDEGNFACRDRNGAGARRTAAPSWSDLFSVKALTKLALLLTIAGSAPTVEGQSSEYDVKAAFLFHFAQFVEWPTEAFKDATSPLTYCTIGGDKFHGALDESLKGKSVAGRTLRVMHLQQTGQINGCQVLFVGSEDKKPMQEALAEAAGRAVLTVGDSEHFAQDGGMIGFCLEEKKVRFEINVGAANKEGLKISAKLLSLAKTVIGSRKGT